MNCLYCGTKIPHPDGELIPKCPRCGFRNIKLSDKWGGENPVEEFLLYEEDEDPLFVMKLQKEEGGGSTRYAWPPLTKQEFVLFKEKSPERATALLKLLRGEPLSEREDASLRILKSLSKSRGLETRLQYLQTKKKIVDLLYKIK